MRACVRRADDGCFAAGVGKGGADSRCLRRTTFMLPAPHRLRGKRSLQRVQFSPHVFRIRAVTLRMVRRGDEEPARISIAVSRRVSTRAVERNTITRWLREAVRALLPRLRPGVDLRFSATAPAAHYSYQECVAGVETLLAKARLLRE